MNWCIDRGTIETSPVAHLKMPTKEVARERVLNSEELRLAWHMSDAEGLPFGPCVQLLMLTGQRRGEVSGMRWSELDLDNAIWTIPAKRAKNGSTHVVPLAPAAVEIIRSVPRYLNSDFVFTTTGRTPISGLGYPYSTFLTPTSYPHCRSRAEFGSDRFPTADCARSSPSGLNFPSRPYRSSRCPQSPARGSFVSLS
jgi:integrase